MSLPLLTRTTSSPDPVPVSASHLVWQSAPLTTRSSPPPGGKKIDFRKASEEAGGEDDDVGSATSLALRVASPADTPLTALFRRTTMMQM